MPHCFRFCPTMTACDAGNFGWKRVGWQGRERSWELISGEINEIWLNPTLILRCLETFGIGRNLRQYILRIARPIGLYRSRLYSDDCKDDSFPPENYRCRSPPRC